ncbi:MAG TPA: hypothetical protein VK066_02805 [Chloroflexota bacterium]|nr:hypothetical protein [Chloroflexota bacterium]
MEFAPQDQATATAQAKKDQYLRMMEKVPTQVYLGLALGSVLTSAGLRVAGKKDAALFVGQWPPTLLLLALVHKLLQPSQEPGIRKTQEALDAARGMVAESS